MSAFAYCCSMPDKDQAVSQLAQLAYAVAADSGLEQMLLRPFEWGSDGRDEESHMFANGVDDSAPTSMFSIRALLDAHARAALEHLRASAVLLDQSGAEPQLLSIAALGRISCEASATAFWLAEPGIGWRARLARCNGLQRYSVQQRVKQGQQQVELYATSPSRQALGQLRELLSEMDEWREQMDLEDVRRPSYSDLMQALAENDGQESAEAGRLFYALGSSSVHSDPLMVERALGGLSPAASTYSAALKIQASLRCWRWLHLRICEWSGWEPAHDPMATSERITLDLMMGHLGDVARLPWPREDIMGYIQHLQETLGQP